jgi:hypothetical protein
MATKARRPIPGCTLSVGLALATSGAVTIAELLAYLPAGKLLLQGTLREEQMLSTLTRWVSVREHAPPWTTWVLTICGRKGAP